MQISLTGFLESKSAPFCKELWKLLISAQESPGGVPKEFVEEAKKHMLAKEVIISLYT
jgi:serine/arginine repetitive matrix protein 1